MVHPIDTLGKAVRRGMLVHSKCKRCGNVRLYRASDLMMVFGGGRDPLTPRFRCAKCVPDIKVTLVDVDLGRRAGRLSDGLVCANAAALRPGLEAGMTGRKPRGLGNPPAQRPKVT
jgi:hypothetical protein